MNIESLKNHITTVSIIGTIIAFPALIGLTNDGHLLNTLKSSMISTWFFISCFIALIFGWTLQNLHVFFRSVFNETSNAIKGAFTLSTSTYGACIAYMIKTKEISSVYNAVPHIIFLISLFILITNHEIFRITFLIRSRNNEKNLRTHSWSYFFINLCKNTNNTHKYLINKQAL